MGAGWLVRERSGRLAQRANGQTLPLEGPSAHGGLPVERVRHAAGPTSLLTLDTEEGLQAWRSDDGLHWECLPPPPPPAVVGDVLGLFPEAGVVGFVTDGRAILGDPSGWREMALPRGARWIGFGQSRWWAVGRRPAEGAVEAVPGVWARHGDAWTPVDVKLTWWNRAKALLGGAMESFEGLDAAGVPLVLASECSWFLDDPAWSLFTQRADGRFTVTRLPGPALCGLARDEEGWPVASTVDGELWRWRDGRWRSACAARPLAATLEAAGVPRRRSIRVEGTGLRLRGVARWWPAGTPTQTIGVGSDDGGRSWFTEPTEDLTFLAGWVRRGAPSPA